MSATKRRSRRQRPTTTSPVTGAQPAAVSERDDRGMVLPLPEWKWRTFPVYFALTLGLMVGVWAGSAAGVNAEDGDDQPLMILFIVSALLFGFALSRLTTRLMLSKQWIKPRRKSR